LNAKVHDLMTPSVVTTQPHVTVSHARAMMATNRIGAVPVVDSEDHPVGILSATDLLADLNPTAPIHTVMTEKVYTVPEYDDASTAARVMRNHKIHRVVVTREGKIAGVLSAFDLLDLVAGHRFTMKNAPTKSTRKASKRR
jgi:CBS domain-containing protein